MQFTPCHQLCVDDLDFLPCRYNPFFKSNRLHVIDLHFRRSFLWRHWNTRCTLSSEFVFVSWTTPDAFCRAEATSWYAYLTMERELLSNDDGNISFRVYILISIHVNLLSHACLMSHEHLEVFTSFWIVVYITCALTDLVTLMTYLVAG